MADINSSIQISKESQNVIDVRLKSAFTYSNWSDDELAAVRKEIRDFYRKEQKGICSYCRQSLSLVSALNCHVEHIVPKSLHLDFIFTPKNLCVICADCNQIKKEQETLGEIPQTMTKANSRKRYPISSRAFKIIHPHFDNYEDHILVLNGYYIDKGSKKGNFTIGACKLNRKLAAFGWEPEITNDKELINNMNAYIEEDDSLKRTKHLSNLKKKLFNI